MCEVDVPFFWLGVAFGVREVWTYRVCKMSKVPPQFLQPLDHEAELEHGGELEDAELNSHRTPDCAKKKEHVRTRQKIAQLRS